MTRTRGAARDGSASAAEFLPADADLAGLRRAARDCRGCDLYQDATQTVFGAGPDRARWFLLGEQPGDQEDRLGAPFVGPAGRVLDRALDELGVDRAEVYLSNAVKHFRFVRDERGKRRIHKTPARSQITACRPWWRAELAQVRPQVLVCLGATAAQAVLGPDFRLSQHRGELLTDLPDGDGLPGGLSVLATTHPSAVLRAPDRDAAYTGLVSDLRVALASG